MKVLHSFALLATVVVPTLANADPRFDDQLLLDTRYQRRELGDLSQDALYLKVESLKSITNDGAYKFWSRGEFWFAANDVPARDNPSGKWQRGFRDPLLTGAVVTKPAENVRAGLGLQVSVPITDKDSFGFGRWLITPGAIVEADMPNGYGFGQFTYRDVNDVGGQQDRRKINHFNIIELMGHINLPYYSDIEIKGEYRRDFVSNQEFLAPSVSIHHWLKRGLQIGASYSHATVTQIPVYDRQYELQFIAWY